MRFDDIQPLDEAPKKPAGGAGAFGQMGNTLSGANKSKSSTGGTITRTPTGLVHTAKPGADKPAPTPKPGAPTPAPTPGSANTGELTKAWIQYLKNNQIVALQSDPKTGQLAYKKKVTTDNLSQFLRSETDYDKEVINSTIQSVMAKGAAPEQVKQHTGGKVAGQLSQSPGAIKKRDARTAQKQPQPPQPGEPVNEAMIDKPIEISEKDVEAVFSALLSQAPSGASAEEPAAEPSTEPAPEDAEKKGADLEKLKNLIGTGMTSAQRKELWTSLKGTALSESRVDRREAIQILKYAAKIKHTIKLEDLQASWSKAGYPTDLDEIAKILNKAGFGRTDIKDIFDEVIGDDGSEDYEDEESGPSPTIIKIIDYINKNGIKDDILAYMEEEFGDELNAPEPEQKGWFDKVKDFGKRMFTREATVKEIEQIFTKILLKERTELPMRIKEQDRQNLGRQRK